MSLLWLLGDGGWEDVHLTPRSTDLGFSNSVGREKLTPHSLNLSVMWKSGPKKNFYLNGDGPVQLTDSLKYTKKYFSPCCPHLCSLRTTYVDPSVSDACLLSDIMELNSPCRSQSIQKHTCRCSSVRVVCSMWKQ